LITRRTKKRLPAMAVDAGIVVRLTANWLASVYAFVNRRIGLKQPSHLLEATAGATALLLVSCLSPGVGHLLLPTGIATGGLIALCAVAGFRFYSRIFQERGLRNVTAERRLLLVGVGAAGSVEQVMAPFDKRSVGSLSGHCPAPPSTGSPICTA